MNKIRKLFLNLWLAGLFSCLVLSCASVRFVEDPSAYQTKINTLIARIKADSTDTKALRDLGVIYFQARRYALADTCLRRAFGRGVRDAKTVFYLGLAREFTGKIDQALLLYGNYKNVARLSPYRRLMAGRYHQLTLDVTRQEVRALLVQEQQLREDRMAPSAVAVFPLRYLGRNKKFAPLGKGLSELIIGDLGQVRALKLLERIRLQALLDEMALASKSDFFDQSTAPRYGKLLGAGRIVAGAYNVVGKEQLRIDVQSWDIINRNFPAAATEAEALQNIFRLEKTIVFNVIADIGIELTQEEREKIQFIPTQNLQAFLAYSRGLEEEDAGRFDAAANFYQQAIKLDPNFGAALTKTEIAQGMIVAGSKEKAATAAQKIDPLDAESSTTQSDLVSERLQNLSLNTGSNFVPGQDSRKPAEELNKAYGDLRQPPSPPRQ